MITALEIKNQVAGIYITTVTAINLSAEIALFDQPIEIALRKEDVDSLSETGIGITGQTTKEALLLIRDWLNKVEIA